MGSPDGLNVVSCCFSITSKLGFFSSLPSIPYTPVVQTPPVVFSKVISSVVYETQNFLLTLQETFNLTFFVRFVFLIVLIIYFLCMVQLFKPDPGEPVTRGQTPNMTDTTVDVTEMVRR